MSQVHRDRRITDRQLAILRTGVLLNQWRFFARQFWLSLTDDAMQLLDSIHQQLLGSTPDVLEDCLTAESVSRKIIETHRDAKSHATSESRCDAILDDIVQLEQQLVGELDLDLRLECEYRNWLAPIERVHFPQMYNSLSTAIVGEVDRDFLSLGLTIDSVWRAESVWRSMRAAKSQLPCPSVDYPELFRRACEGTPTTPSHVHGESDNSSWWIQYARSNLSQHSQLDVLDWMPTCLVQFHRDPETEIVANLNLSNLCRRLQLEDNTHQQILQLEEHAEDCRYFESDHFRNVFRDVVPTPEQSSVVAQQWIAVLRDLSAGAIVYREGEIIHGNERFVLAAKPKAKELLDSLVMRVSGVPSAAELADQLYADTQHNRMNNLYSLVNRTNHDLGVVGLKIVNVRELGGYRLQRYDSSESPG